MSQRVTQQAVSSVFPSDTFIAAIHRSRYGSQGQITPDLAASLDEEINLAFVNTVRSIAGSIKQDRFLLNTDGAQDTPNLLFATKLLKELRLTGTNAEDHALGCVMPELRNLITAAGRPMRVDKEHVLFVDFAGNIILERQQEKRPSHSGPQAAATA